MKKFYAKNFAYGAAALLVGAVGLTGCSSDDELTNVNPTYDGESVKAQFAINIPVAGKQGTRVSQEIVQGQSTPIFRGIEDIYLVPFKTTPAVGQVGEEPIRLGAIQPNELGEGTGAKVYYDIALETGVNNFLFYGKAMSDDDDELTNGALDVSVSKTVNDITFNLRQITSEGENDSQIETLKNALNNIARATGGGVAWSASKTALKNFYNSFIRLKAGSAASIKLALKDLKDGVNGVSLSSETDLQTAIVDAIDAAIDETKGTIKDCNYPRNLHLPDGSAQLHWTGTEFEYVNSTNIGNLSYTSMDNFVYPSALYYWVNTPIKTSDSPQADNYETDWNTCLGKYENDNASVDATTASVALTNPINYAVARLDVAARFNSATVTDNLGGTVTIGNENGITMDGLLIGGQKGLKWDFNNPVDGATEKTIYDASITSTKLSDSEISGVMAHSLALQTAQGTEVRFALELTNNTGASFTGKDGIVPNGGRFYLIGVLTPKQNTADNRVFYQDHITYAKVAINSLENAYNCIPDLKSPKLELGLSVDLDWQSGLVDDVTIE